MPQKIDEIGNRYGMLLVIEEAPRKKGEPSVRWRCRCDCGKERIVSRTLLRNGSAKSCGCTHSHIDETGNRYGKLSVIEEMPREKGDQVIRWRCRCDCGRETVVCGTSLRSGNTKSCGCLHRETIYKNEAGKRYGKWLVLEEEPRSPCEPVRWRCRCDCGTERAVCGNRLRRGHSTSCGCSRKKANIERPISKSAREVISRTNTIDEMGKKYGHLLVVKKAPERKNGQVCWCCLCDCGKYVTVSGNALRKGRATSCGCHEKNEVISRTSTIDEMGKKYGHLLVVKKVPERKNGLVCWRCLCDCGKYATVTGDALRKGRATSCGCKKKEV